MGDDQFRLCTRCGERSGPHSKFCWKCGRDLSLPPVRYFSSRGERARWFPVVLVAVAVLAGKIAIEYLPGLFPREPSLARPTSTAYPRDPSPPKPTTEGESVVSVPLVPVTSTFWPEDHRWGSVDDWTIFETAQTACFAKKSFPNNVNLVLGRMKDTGDFVLGMTGRVPATDSRTLNLVFDGRRRRQPFFGGSSKVIVGRYAHDAGLAEEISRSASVQVTGTNSQTVTIPMVGTRAALAAVNDCVRAMPPIDVDKITRGSSLPNERLCEDKPQNGGLLTRRAGLGAPGHIFTVRNSSQGDAIVKLRQVDTGQLAYSFFVHRNEQASIKGIADGAYRIQFAYGDVLLAECSDFSNPIASQFDRPYDFKTKIEKSRTGVTTYTHTLTATLYAVSNGNAPTSKIDQASFLKD